MFLELNKAKTSDNTILTNNELVLQKRSDKPNQSIR